jgi:hypothetical protein
MDVEILKILVSAMIGGFGTLLATWFVEPRRLENAMTLALQKHRLEE